MKKKALGSSQTIFIEARSNDRPDLHATTIWDLVVQLRSQEWLRICYLLRLLGHLLQGIF